MDFIISFFRDTLDGPLYIVVAIICGILICSCIGYLAECSLNKKKAKEKYEESHAEVANPMQVVTENVVETTPVDVNTSQQMDTVQPQMPVGSPTIPQQPMSNPTAVANSMNPQIQNTAVPTPMNPQIQNTTVPTPMNTQVQNTVDTNAGVNQVPQQVSIPQTPQPNVAVPQTMATPMQQPAVATTQSVINTQPTTVNIPVGNVEQIPKL